MVNQRTSLAWVGLVAGMLAVIGVLPARSGAPGPVLDYPLDGTLYPPNLAPPTWSWQGEGPWVVTAGAGIVRWEVDEPRLTPTTEQWVALAEAAQGDSIALRVCAAAGDCAGATFGWSAHPFEGDLTYRLVRPPFGGDPLYRTRLMIQRPDESTAEPLAEGLSERPCMGCHAVGEAVAVQVRDPYDPHVGLVDDTVDGVIPLDLPVGPFGRCSGLAWTADGVLVVAMNLRHTDDRVAGGFRLTHHSSDLAFVDPTTGGWSLIPGASDPAAVEDFPDVSPDGATLAFVRGAELVTDRGALDIHLLRPGDEVVSRPLAGASGDGEASYFPRFSPDGRWIAFVHSDGGYFARPSSDLYLVPAGGGEAVRLAVNTVGRMDSWPSWSLDGRWLVWASRRDDPDVTRAFLAEVDEDGRCSPPVPYPLQLPTGWSVNQPTIARAHELP